MNIEQIKHQLEIEFSVRETNLQKYYEERWGGRQCEVDNLLRQWLLTLTAIKRDIEVANVDQMVKETEAAVSERMTMEKQIVAVREENQRVVQ
jgi:hypothetical protein